MPGAYKSMKFLTILSFCSLVWLGGCRHDTTLDITADGAAVSLRLPVNASAAELINMQTALTNALTIKAERERQAFVLAAARQRAQERQFYAVLLVGGVVAGIVAIFAIACVVVVGTVRRVWS